MVMLTVRFAVSDVNVSPPTVSTFALTVLMTRGPLLSALPSMKTCCPTLKPIAAQVPLASVRVWPESVIEPVAAGSRNDATSMSTVPLGAPTAPCTTSLTLAPMILGASIVVVVSETSFSRPALTA